MKISLKSEISKKDEKILLSDFVLLESALIYTYSVKFLFKAKVSLKIGNIFYIHVYLNTIYYTYLKIYLSVYVP